jgi:Bacterial Ig-like domain (group 3)
MFSLRAGSFGRKTGWYVLAMPTCALATASAFGQIATSTTVSLAPTPVYYGQTPVATVTVTASDGSIPAGSVSCNILTRGHNAAYASPLQNGVVSINLSSVSLDPVQSDPYTLVCSYTGSATYAASTATTLPFEIIFFSAWIVNSDGTVSQLDYTGKVLATLGTPGASASAGGIAIDSSHDAWAVTNTANSLVFVSPGTNPSPGINQGPAATSTFTGGGLLQPTAVAIDGAGQVWIANGGNSVSSFSNSGTAQSPATGYGATTAAAPTPYNAPSGIAVDQAGSVWITNSGGNTVTRIFGSAAPVVAPLVTGAANGTTGTRP